jgi:hypothetical protein
VLCVGAAQLLHVVTDQNLELASRHADVLPVLVDVTRNTAHSLASRMHVAGESVYACSVAVAVTVISMPSINASAVWLRCCV